VAELPNLEYTCAKCGSSETFELVPASPSERATVHISAETREPTELDFICSQCGARETFQLVPSR
jgi:5-methylcytosine-specific restriction endonuclease McrA